METTFIYALCEPNSRRVRYIGKANDPEVRFKQHLSSSVKRDTHLGKWIRSLLSLGEKPNMVVLREIPFDQWEIAEERYIRLARGLGISLTNATDGGEGQVNPTPETRFKIGSAQRGKTGEKSSFFGRRHTPESLAKLSAALTGRKYSSELRASMSIARKGKKRTPETCENIRASKLGDKNGMKGRKHTEESLLKMRAAHAKRLSARKAAKI